MYILFQGVFCDGCATGQVAYGAVILSFLGGVRWGMVVIPAGPVTPNWANYLYSVTPPLIAWSALLMPVVPGDLDMTKILENQTS